MAPKYLAQVVGSSELPFTEMVPFTEMERSRLCLFVLDFMGFFLGRRTVSGAWC